MYLYLKRFLPMVNAVAPQFSSNIIVPSTSVFRNVTNALGKLSLFEDHDKDFGGQFNPVDKFQAVSSPCIIGSLNSSKKAFPFHFKPMRDMKQAYKKADTVLLMLSGKVKSILLTGGTSTLNSSKRPQMWMPTSDAVAADLLTKIKKTQSVDPSYFLFTKNGASALYLSNDPKKYGKLADSYILFSLMGKDCVENASSPQQAFKNWVAQFQSWFVSDKDKTYVAEFDELPKPGASFTDVLDKLNLTEINKNERGTAQPLTI